MFAHITSNNTSHIKYVLSGLCENEFQQQEQVMYSESMTLSGVSKQLTQTTAPGTVLRWGSCPQTSALHPKCDMKQCLTNSKHMQIGAIRNVLWPSKYAKMHFQMWLCSKPLWESSRCSQRPPSSFRRGYLLISYPTQRLDSTAYGARNSP